MSMEAKRGVRSGVEVWARSPIARSVTINRKVAKSARLVPSPFGRGLGRGPAEELDRRVPDAPFVSPALTPTLSSSTPLTAGRWEREDDRSRSLIAHPH